MTTSSSVLAPHRLHNLRPVGGLPTRDGNRVRADLVFRSAAPFAERESSALAVVSLGVTTVVDLRDQAERERTPGAWQHDSLTVHSRPIFGDMLHSMRFDGLGELYGIMLNGHGERLAGAFDVVASHAARGVLFHCTAGKDRTGMLSALVLEVLGVERELTLTDFSLSQERLGPDYLADLFGGVDVATLPGLAAHRATSSPPELLAGALTRIDDEFGGAESFLMAHGVSASRVSHLRESLLE